MTNQNGDGPHKTAPEVPVGRPFSPGHDDRRNPGGRPRGLARMAREAVGDGADLVDLMTAVLKGDAKRLRVRTVPLRDRLQAAAWFSDRGWGKAVTVVELPDAPAGPFTPEQAAAIKEMPPELKDGIRRWLAERREEYIAREREAAEQRMLSYMPPVGPNGNGDGAR